ncbi:uncharacterized protein LOC135940905 isoform X1 [Cloeon dipterum]|uniref:uncharacterized protein LOC135940905 isoform X1 n=1 Tax=Cloeon dipterum TaxID=197152 RepID=UPI00321F676B
MYGKGSGRPGREDDSQVCHAVVGVERAQDASPAPHLEPRGLLPVSRTSVAAALSGRLGAMRPPVVAREHSPCAGPSHKGVGIGQQGARGCPGGGQRPHQLKFLFDDVKRATLAHQMGAHFKAAYAVDPSPDAASSRAGFALASDNERSTAAPKRPLAQLQPNATGLAQSLPCHNPGSAELPPPAKPARRGDTLSVARSAPCKLLAVPDAGSHIGSMKRKAMRKISLGENAHQLEVVHSETDSPLRKKTFKRKCNIPFCDSNERKDAAVKFFTVTTVRKLREEYYRFCEMASDRYRRPPNPRYAIYCCYLHYDAENDFIKKSDETLALKPGVSPLKVYKHEINGEYVWLDYPSHEAIQQAAESRRQLFDCAGENDDWPESLSSNNDGQQDHHTKELEEVQSLCSQARSTAQSISSAGSDIFSGDDTESTSSSYRPPSVVTASSTDSDIQIRGGKAKEYRKTLKSVSIELMMDHPEKFLGVPPYALFVVDELAAAVSGPHALEDVLLTLRRVKLMESYSILGLYFNLSRSAVSKIFRKTLPTIAECLKELLVNTPTTQIKYNLPVAFRYNFSNTTDILDAFEIQCQKPTDALYQMLSYSTYKGCNTIKYLVNCTPDGFITFVSRGYGGRLSDVALCEESGYLKFLTPGRSVMADRGFKHLESRLELIGVGLVRPPSVMKNMPLSKSDTLKTKQIAALRIHVERVIGRIRCFAMASPHSRTPVSQIPLLDMAVVVAAALCNIGTPIIRV